jgi:hypothetical protein
MFWVAVLAISILLYALLDGFDLGVGILFGVAGDDERRATMLSAVSPVWDGNETWLVVTGVVLWGAFPPVYATLFSAFYLPLLLMLTGLVLRGVAFEYRHRAEASDFHPFQRSDTNCLTSAFGEAEFDIGGPGWSKSITSSPTTTRLPRRGVTRHGSSYNSFRKRFAWASDHSG